MPNLMIKRVGYDENSDSFTHATDKVVLSDKYDFASPLRPEQVVTVTEEDAAQLLATLPFQLELTQEEATREVFDLTQDDAWQSLPSIFGPFPEQVVVPELTPEQEADVQRRIAEAEASAQSQSSLPPALRGNAPVELGNTPPPPPMDDPQERALATEHREHVESPAQPEQPMAAPPAEQPQPAQPMEAPPAEQPAEQPAPLEPNAPPAPLKPNAPKPMQPKKNMGTVKPNAKGKK